MNDLLMKSSKIKYKSLIPSTEVIQLTLTLKITTAHVLETSVTVNNNSPIHNHVHPDHETQATFKIAFNFIQIKFVIVTNFIYINKKITLIKTI